MNRIWHFFPILVFSSLLYGQELIEYDYEIDAYYSNVSMFIDLDKDKEIEEGSHLSEVDLYKKLLLNSFNPNIFLVEASVNPVGALGLAYRKNYPNEYERSKINNFNWIKALTAGFEEPYALSFFVGNMIVFKNHDNEEHIGNNRAYVGYLVTIGDYTIKDNLAHKDKWINFEVKIKGTRKKKERDLDWSFRVGTKIHENQDIADTIYVGARRSSIDYNKPIASLRYNSAFSSMISVTADTFKLSQLEFVLEKKWPLKVSWLEKMSFGLGLGYLYYSGEKYRGALKEEGIDAHQLILRPNLTW